MKIEMEIGVLLPQAIECLEPLEIEGGKEGFSPSSFRGSSVLFIS